MNIFDEINNALKDRMKQIDALEDRVKALESLLTTDSKALDSRTPLSFPAIDGSAIPEKPSVIAAKRLGFEPFAYSERS